MKRVVLLSLLGLTAACQSAGWFTVAGHPDDPAVDVVQIDPVPLRVLGSEVTMRVRVSRAAERKTARGTSFRSFESQAVIDCKDQTAHFVTASFYAEPGFQGQPFKTENYEGTEKRPMAFRQIEGNPAQRIITAACKTLVN